MRIISRVVGIPLHTVTYSVFGPFVAEYFSSSVFALASFSWFGRLAFIACDPSLTGNVIVVVLVRTGRLGGTVDGNCLFISVIPKFTVLPVYGEDGVGSQLSWQELCVASRREVLSWGGFLRWPLDKYPVAWR